MFKYCYCVSPQSHFPDKQTQFFQSFPYLRFPSLVWILVKCFMSFLAYSTQNGHNSPAEALREERWSGRTISNRPTKMNFTHFTVKCGSWCTRLAQSLRDFQKFLVFSWLLFFYNNGRSLGTYWKTEPSNACYRHYVESNCHLQWISLSKGWPKADVSSYIWYY